MGDAPIEGKVAKILNERQIVINRGATSGVENGMIFKIISSSGLDVEDPDTGEVLGDVELIKTYVKIEEVQEKMAIAATFVKKKYKTGGSLTLPDFNMFAPERTVTRVETLALKDNYTFPELSEEESFVKVHDIVREITEQEAERVFGT